MDTNENSDMTVPVPPEPPKPGVFVPQPDGQVEVPSYASEPLQGEPVFSGEAPSYATGEVVTPPVKKDNKKIWIIVAIVVAVLCCCCIVVTIAALRSFDNFDINQFEDLLDQYNNLKQVLPAFI